MRISDWSSDVCSSDLSQLVGALRVVAGVGAKVALHAGPGLDREAPEAGESGRVLVPEAVGRVVGGQAVVVEAVGTAPSCDLAGAGREVEPDVGGDVALALHHDGVERLVGPEERRGGEEVGRPGYSRGGQGTDKK